MNIARAARVVLLAALLGHSSFSGLHAQPAPAKRLAQNQNPIPQPSTLNSRPTPANKVLDLDGKGSYVELPPNISNGLEEATVEGWGKWETWGNYSRFFDFGEPERMMVVTEVGISKDLQFEIWSPRGQIHALSAANLLPTNQWCRIAAVSGKDGMKLYFNGVLVGIHDFAGSFTTINMRGTCDWTVTESCGLGAEQACFATTANGSHA